MPRLDSLNFAVKCEIIYETRQPYSENAFIFSERWVLKVETVSTFCRLKVDAVSTGRRLKVETVSTFYQLKVEPPKELSLYLQVFIGRDL